MLRLVFLAAAMIGCVWLSGCDFPEIKRPPTGNFGGMDNDLATQVSGGGSGNTDSTVTQTPAVPAEVRSEMQVGAQEFKQGHYEKYGKTSILDYQVTSYFRMRERISIMMIEHNMDLYKAGHDNQFPKTYEEYQREILPGIKLPELIDDCRYEYDPETGILYVVHPE